MGYGIYSSMAGAKSRALELEVLANNIANVSTVGFKEMGVAFNSTLDKAVSEQSDEMPNVNIKSKDLINFTDGSVYKTDNPLDFALQGDGFFQVQTKNGMRFTRNGHFTMDKSGTLVTQQGDAVQGSNGPITITPGTRLTISNKGEISADGESMGTLRVMTFDEKKKVKLEGNNYYSAEGLQPRDSTNYMVSQGFLEGANVSLIRNLTRIVEVSRAYETCQKSMSQQSEVSQKLNQLARSM